MVRHSRWIVLAFSCQLCLAVGASAQSPDFDDYLARGRIQAGIDAAETWLSEHPADHQAHLGLGMLRFVQAVEGLCQDLHHYGLRDLGRSAGMLPFLRVPVPENPNPAQLDYAASREILVRVIARLKTAEAALARVEGDAKVRIRLAAVRLDMDGDGKATSEESLWSIYQRLNAQARQLADESDAFTVAFDRADAHWLRGYCNLLMAFAEFTLAHEWRDAFERTSHVFFANVDSPYPFLRQGRGVFRIGDGIDIVDVIAFVHLINYPCIEPKRMVQARLHLKEMLQQSREMWRYANAETDNDREWIPNARQTALVPNVKVSEQMIEDWQIFLDEADALLDGRKLIPFWRGDSRQGVNLQNVFLEPTRFDLVMWIQGTAAAPYLETGEITSPDTWSRLQRTFQGNFWGFAIWFN